MHNTNPRNAVAQYNQVGVQSAGAEVSPHRLVQMLLEGALDKIAIARGHMERGAAAEKGRHISWALSIISGLRASLDKSAGREIAENLDRLYEYIESRLLTANIQNDVSMLDECVKLLGQVKSAWDEITPAATTDAKPAVAAR